MSICVNTLTAAATLGKPFALPDAPDAAAFTPDRGTVLTVDCCMPAKVWGGVPLDVAEVVVEAAAVLPEDPDEVMLNSSDCARMA
jgi:hypothetical protein